MNRRGVSAVIATVLIVMVTVSTVAIIWMTIIPTIKESLEESTSEKVSLSIETDGGYTTWDEIQQIARVQVKRGNDKANLTGMDFNFIKGGNTRKNQTDKVPSPGTTLTYSFNLSGFGKPDKINIAPVTKKGVAQVSSAATTLSNYIGVSSGQESCESYSIQEGAFVLCSCEDLQNMSANLSAIYSLGQNVDCSGLDFLPVGNSTKKFTGSFNGEGYIITGLYINKSSEDYVGLFGYAEGVRINNLSFENLSVTGYSGVGGLVGFANETSINNIKVGGVIRGYSLVGSILGGETSSFITNTNATGNVSVIRCEGLTGRTLCLISQGLLGGGCSDSNTFSNSFFTGYNQGVWKENLVPTCGSIQIPLNPFN